MSEQARVALTIHGNTFEISGPEGFVSAQVESFREAMIYCWTSAVNSPPEDEEEEGAKETEQPPPAPHHEPTNGKLYENILHMDKDSGKVQILKSVPGTTTSKKAVGTVIIYLWAKREIGVDSVPHSELREVCKSHVCLDAPNFAKHMKAAREWIIVDGDKHSSLQTCKLTVPGVKAAEALLQQLNEEQSAENSRVGE